MFKYLCSFLLIASFCKIFKISCFKFLIEMNIYNNLLFLKNGLADSNQFVKETPCEICELILNTTRNELAKNTTQVFFLVKISFFFVLLKIFIHIILKKGSYY
jgi:hypothetical protein